MQASSDLSIVDFDIPYSLSFVMIGAIEVVTTIVIIATVTWQVLVVAVPALIITIWVQVNFHTKFPITISYLLKQLEMMEGTKLHI